jgi:predicted metalloendopeptidase
VLKRKKKRGKKKMAEKNEGAIAAAAVRHQAKFNKYKSFYKTHHHVNGSDFSFWLFFFLIVAFFVVFLVLIWVRPLPPPPPPPAKRSVTSSQRLSQSHSAKRTACALGENFDSDLGICVPIFRAPVALEGAIIDATKPACDSFFNMMCGKWTGQHVNEHRTFSYAYHANQVILKRLILETLPLHDFHTSCTSATTQKKESELEFRHQIEVIAGDWMRSAADLPRSFGLLARAGYTSWFKLRMERNPFGPGLVPLFAYENFADDLQEHEVINLVQQTQELHKLNILQMDYAIQGFLKVWKMLKMQVKKANNIFYSANATYEEYMERQARYDFFQFKDLVMDWNLGSSNVKGWRLFFQALGFPQFNPDQIVWVPGKVQYFDWVLNQGLVNAGFQDWKNFVTISVLWNSYGYKPRDWEPVYRFASSLKKRDQDNSAVSCDDLTQAMLPGLVAEEYLRRVYPNGREPVRNALLAIITSLRAAQRKLIRDSSWLSPSDKQVLTDKVDNMLVRVIEPDEWEPEPFGASLARDRFDHNMNLIRRYRVRHNLEQFFTSQDAKHTTPFAMPLTEVNAYYSGQSNSITILAPMGRRPFFDLAFNDISRFAILGSVIGHELSHALDKNGLYWDANGTFHKDGILSPEGMRTFFDRSDCVIIEYGPAPGGCEDVNVAYGNATVGEDLADLTGIHLAYDAYMTQNPNAPTSDKQHFFMILAQTFCSSFTQEALCNAVQNDEHAIAEYRIDRTFRNFREFHQAFGCSGGSGMFREKVCRVYGPRVA